MYYQYFTFWRVKGLDYTRNMDFSLIFLQIFFQNDTFRKFRITVISSSQWRVVSTFWVIWGNRLMKPLIFRDYTKIITCFILRCSKMFLFRLLSLTIKRDITLHKRATVSIWFIEPWRINEIPFWNWWNSFTLCIFHSKYILIVVVSAWLSFTSILVNS